MKMLTTTAGGRISKPSSGPQRSPYLTPPPKTGIRWGFQILPEEHLLRCLKLLLDPGQTVPDYVSLSATKRMLAVSGKTMGTAVADLLRAVHNHAKETKCRRLGDYFINTAKIELICTAPAVWSDAAKNAILKVAESAGMKDILLVSEPEAGALYTLQAIQPNHLKVGSVFVVIDAGGGTVDLASYRIQQLTPLRLEEVVQGKGGFCGAAFLNVRFETWVESKLGVTRFCDIQMTKPRSWLMALKNFEDYVNRNFDPEEERVFNIPFPGIEDDLEAGLEDEFLSITSLEVAEIFQPILADIFKLVRGQIDAVHASGYQVSGLVLIGGFGQSECLLKCMKTEFGGVPTSGFGGAGFVHVTSGMQILQPVNTWTAVVPGAVLRGLETKETVLSRKARRHYGVEYRNPCNASIHDASLKVWDSLEQNWKADHQMELIISKGQTVSSSTPVTFSCSRTFSGGQSLTIQEALIYCDNDHAPRTFHSAAGSATRKLCTLVVNLAEVPRELWKQYTN